LAVLDVQFPFGSTLLKGESGREVQSLPFDCEVQYYC